MSKVKYKKGTRKVLMVTDVTNDTHKSNYHEGTRLIVTEFDSRGHVHRIYLECDEDEQFNKGDLIAAVCIRTHFKNNKGIFNYNITDWKRIS